MTNKNNKVLNTGVRSELRNGVLQHKTHFYAESFTSRYNCEKIVWFEMLDNISVAISRKKQLKGGNRKNKIELIEKLNPACKDLWEEVQE